MFLVRIVNNLAENFFVPGTHFFPCTIIKEYLLSHNYETFKFHICQDNLFVKFLKYLLEIRWLNSKFLPLTTLSEDH